MRRRKKRSSRRRRSCKKKRKRIWVLVTQGHRKLAILNISNLGTSPVWRKCQNRKYAVGG
jgi:hypothetical protein